MPAEEEFAQLADPYRRELLAHCYRMLGSVHDAEDLVQETYLRAWRAYDKFEERSSLRTWLYRIATRACLTALTGRERRVLPSGLGGGQSEPDAPLAARLDAVGWLEPIPTGVLGDPNDPADIVAARETTRLAFVATLQHLPPKQRAALLLRDVLGWHADEVADLLGTSQAAANSALQRARAHLAGSTLREDQIGGDAGVDAAVLDRFVAAFENADVDGLARLLRADVELEMPPVPTWFAGQRAVLGFFAHRAFAGGGRRLIRASANGYPAAATYVGGSDGVYRPHSLQVLELRDGLVARIHAFLDPRLFPVFGMPDVAPSAGYDTTDDATDDHARA